MKLSVFVMMAFIVCLCCSCSERILEARVNIESQTLKNVYSADSADQPTGTPEDVSKNSAHATFSVDLYEDNKLVSRSFYWNGLCTKMIIYGAETKRAEIEVEYFYKDNGEFDHQKAIQGQYADDSEEMALENKQTEKDFRLHCDFLKFKGISFPLADIAADEINDLSNIYSMADYYHDFKMETRKYQNQEVTKFIGLNKTGRFHNSLIAVLIGNGDDINIKDYELTLENGYPAKETYRVDEGELTKTYSYKDGQLTGVAYQFTDLRNQTNSLKKRFEYHVIK